MFEKALEEPRIRQLSEVEPIKEALRYAMVLIGLRSQNWPGKEETAVMLEYIVSTYGGHRVSEIRLAFKMAVEGKLGVEVNCYENFSVLYFSTVMNAYRNWSEEIFHKMETRPLPLPATIHYQDWRGMIEKDYQLFINSRKAFWRTWPAEYYDQVVEDGYIAAMVYREQMKEAKAALCEDLQKKISLALISEGDEKKRYSGLKDLENKLIEYRNGSRDAEIILLAKQYCILMLFTQAKKEGYQHLYVSE